MSLANLIVQPQAAYLITDSGVYDPGTTRIRALQQKVHWLSGRAVAFTSVGVNPGKPLAAALRQMDATHEAQGEWADPLSDYLAVVKSVYERVGYMGEEHRSIFFAAGWSAAMERAVGFVFSTREGGAGEPPWTWLPADVTMSPCPAAVDVWGADISFDLKDPEIFDPHTDAMGLVQAQRLPNVWGDGSVKGCAVAGQIHLTEVSAEGVKITTLHEYPDRVGELAGAI